MASVRNLYFKQLLAPMDNISIQSMDVLPVLDLVRHANQHHSVSPALFLDTLPTHKDSVHQLVEMEL
jgi:hypothetical protein